VRLKLASRQSDLARWQAVLVARALEKLPQKPHIEFLFKASKGDLDLDTALSAMVEKGVFTQDLYEDLVAGRCDLVVHSWKDLPVEEHADTHIAMTLGRADVRDIFIVPREVWEGARSSGRLEVLTSSPRRMYNLGACLPGLLPGSVEISFVNVRGNVPTRLRKMIEERRGLVIAKAGLDRLLQAEDEGFLGTGKSLRALLADCRFMVLPVRLNPPAPAQGALAVEVRRESEELNTLCASLNDEKTVLCVQRERDILRAHGGGCHQKIGASVIPLRHGTLVCVRGLTEQGETLDTWTLESAEEWSRARTGNDVYPLEEDSRPWFKREPLAVEADLASRPALFISRAEALPAGFVPSAGQVVWTAGSKTWQRLAKLGVWVNGCSEGLGEMEDARLIELTGAPRWTKLTHSGAVKDGNSVATYRLSPSDNPPDLKGKTHFFWTSTSSFERARQLFPREVNEGWNAAGPGSTFDFLRGVSGLKRPAKAFVDLRQFLSETLP
jgi:hydroxymethylbilane synthase